eukprot:5907649-Pleurochrysis_carterae.AAC.1
MDTNAGREWKTCREAPHLDIQVDEFSLGAVNDEDCRPPRRTGEFRIVWNHFDGNNGVVRAGGGIGSEGHTTC